MIYTCPKCGKKMELSTEVLINSDYKVICPQCLSQLQIVGDYAYIPEEGLELDTSIEPSRTINCPKCGHDVNTGVHFCPNCGTSLDSTTTAVDTAPDEVTVLPPPLPNSDPLYNDAVQFLMTCTAITPMMLRDHFHISDERTAELIRQLEQGGAIGPYNNGGPRQILIPHRTIYSYPRSYPVNGGNDNPQNDNPTAQRRGPGCITWFIIIMFIIMVVKSCGG